MKGTFMMKSVYEHDATQEEPFVVVDELADAISDDESLDVISAEEIAALMPSVTPAPARVYDVQAQPLLVACSGGNGHITAINAFHRFFNKHRLTPHTPVAYKEKPLSVMRGGMFVAAFANYFKYLQDATSCLGLPVLPTHHKLSEGIEKLIYNYGTNERLHVDVLLDAYPPGYESAAVWNILQREDKAEELLKLVALQVHNDKIYQRAVTKYFFNLLKRAREEGSPYTEVISTQAIGLPALCDAVKKYNKTYDEDIAIHQYMTDLPTEGATHFFNVLQSLTPSQQQQMKLYAVDFTQDKVNRAFSNGHCFQNVHDIEPTANPMIREGFSNPDYDNSSKHDQTLILAPETEPFITINPNEKVASIMLGSQAGTDTGHYMEVLMEQDVDKIIIFGGGNVEIAKKRDALIAEYTEQAYEKARRSGLTENQAQAQAQAAKHKAETRLVLLGDQRKDSFIASVMTRSNFIITRAGGLSVMEQMAMRHPENQHILIHHAHVSSDGKYTTGIPWEDKNADSLIDYLTPKGVHIQKTCPTHAEDHINIIFGKEPGWQLVA
jgi:effector protein SdbA